MAVVSKPPSNQPQVMLAVFRRSPTFLPAISVVGAVVDEQMSPCGSLSPNIVKPPWPSATMLLMVLVGLVPLLAAKPTAPLVWPEIRLTAPSVDGPKFVL